MPREPDQSMKPIFNRSVEGGVNTRVFALDIRDDQAVELQNIDASTPGQRVKRQGFTLTATGIPNGPILALSEFGPHLGTGSENNIILAVSAGASSGDHKNLWRWDGTGTSWTQVGVLSGYTADPFSDDGQCEITVGYDFQRSNKYVAVIGTEQSGIDRYYYEGTGALGSCHYGSSVAPDRLPFHYAHNRGFGVGEGDYKAHVLFSNVGQFTTTGFEETSQGFVFGGGTGQRIVAIKDFRQQELIVFMSDRIEELIVVESTLNPYAASPSPYTTWSRQVIDPNIGCGAMKSVATVGEDILFADQFGNIRSLARTIQDNNSGTKSVPLSDPIDSWIKRINPSARYRISSVAFDRWYLVGLPIDSAETPSHVFAFDVVRRAWDGPWTGLDPSVMSSAVLQGASQAADRNPRLYIGQTHTAEGRVVRMFDGYEDLGTDVIYREETKRYDFGSIINPKYPRIFKYFGLGSAAATMHFEVNPDGQGYQTLGYVGIQGDAPALPQILPFNLGGSGVIRKTFSLDYLDKVYDLQFRMTCTTPDPVKTLGYFAGAFLETVEHDTDD